VLGHDASVPARLQRRFESLAGQIAAAGSRDLQAAVASALAEEPWSVLA
jgi:hypothetical protein